MEIIVEGKPQCLKWAAAHIIPRHPKCGRVHGHDYTLDIKIVIPESKAVMNLLQSKGYVIDYGDIKSLAKVVIEPLDHHFLIPQHEIVDVPNNDTLLSSTYGITLPKESFCALPIPIVSSENLSLYFKNSLQDKLTNIYTIPVTVYCKVNEGDGQGVWL